MDDPVDRGMPYACSLCGACNEVCPVKIPLTDVILHLRNRVADAEKAEKFSRDPEVAVEKALMKTAGWIFGDAHRFEAVEVATRGAGKVLHGRSLGPIPVPIADRWLKYRDVEAPPTETFRGWWKKNRQEAK